MIGVDIETHDWKKTSGEKGGASQFGFYTRCNSLDYDARIVQIGWVIHDGLSDAIKPVLVQERLVRPDGFEISEKATKYHGITQALAAEREQPLRSVLEGFLQDVVSACDRGERIVVHHLEFDCGIINNDLARAGLERCQPKFRDLACRGVCTMDPDIGKWVRLCSGKPLADFHGGNAMNLPEMVSGLVMGGDSLLKDHHNAGADAHMHVMLYRSLRKLSHSKRCRRSERADG